MKFILFVEGHTERAAVPQFLKRRLDTELSKPVGIQPVRFDGWAEFDREAKRKAEMYLDGPSRGEIIAVVGLLDLYGPTIYPDHINSSDERYAWGVEHYQNKVNRDDFKLHFAVHELEAWILSQPELLPNDVQKALPKSIGQPERVDFDEPPAKLLDRIYKQQTKRRYKKTTYGKNLFARLDPNVAVAKCPRLKAMLDDLLKMAKNAGL